MTDALRAHYRLAYPARAALIAAGRFEALEPPEGIGQPWGWAPSPAASEASQTARAALAAVARVFERAPGEEG